jgi:hypothetical protein
MRGKIGSSADMAAGRYAFAGKRAQIPRGVGKSIQQDGLGSAARGPVHRSSVPTYDPKPVHEQETPVRGRWRYQDPNG